MRIFFVLLLLLFDVEDGLGEPELSGVRSVCELVVSTPFSRAWTNSWCILAVSFEIESIWANGLVFEFVPSTKSP